jgi:hypothetical protein
VRVEAQLLHGDLDHLVGEAPLVVVPAHHLDQVATDHPGQVELHDGGAASVRNTSLTSFGVVSRSSTVVSKAF